MTSPPIGRRFGYAAAAALGIVAASAMPAAAAVYALPKDGNMVGEIRVVTASAASTLLDIARHYDLGSEEIAGANPGVDIWLPKAGQRVVVPTEYVLPPKPWTGMVVNVGARRVYYFPKPKAGETGVVITYPIGIARDDWPTPIGMTRIAAKVRNPSWVVPKDILAEHLKDGDPLPHVVPPGPDNPMGLLALRTAMTGIYIHGTSEPWGVGDRVSHGCMHLYPEDVAEIFPKIPVGTPVRIIDQPFQTGERDGTLYMAGYEPLADYHNPKSPEQRAIESVTAYQGKRANEVDWDIVKKIAKDETTVPIAISAGAPDVAKMIAALPAEPYSFPPYGDDANTAAPPKRQLPVATAPEAPPAGGAAPPGSETNPAGSETPATNAATASPPADSGNATTGATNGVASGTTNGGSEGATVIVPPASDAASGPATDGATDTATQTSRAGSDATQNVASPAAASHAATSSPAASAPAASDPSMAGTSASAPSNPEGIY